MTLLQKSISIWISRKVSCTTENQLPKYHPLLCFVAAWTWCESQQQQQQLWGHISIPHLPSSCCVPALRSFWMIRTSGQGSIALEESRSYSWGSRKMLQWTSEKGGSNQHDLAGHWPRLLLFEVNVLQGRWAGGNTEVLTCSWSEEQETIGLISFPNTSVISPLHHWALVSSLPQPKQEQGGGGCREVAADLGLTPFMHTWQDKVNQATPLLGLGKCPSGENLPKVEKKLKLNSIDSYLQWDIIYSSMHS